MSSTYKNPGWLKKIFFDCLLIFTLGFLIRLTIALILHQVLSAQGKFDLIAGDAEGYWELALDIVHGRDYALYTPPRYIERMPGFPLVIALPLFIIGDSPLAARIWLALLGSLTCCLVYLLCVVCSSRIQGLLAGGLACILPLHAGYSVLFLTESVFALCLLSSLICWRFITLNIKSSSNLKILLGYSILFGLCTALAIYMKPSWLLAPGGLYLWETIIQPGKMSKIIASGLVTLLTIILCLTPWTIRNYIVSQHFVPTTLWMGPSLYDGLNPGATGKSNMHFVDDEQLFQQHSEYEVDQIYRHRAYKFARDNPAQVLKLALIKLGLYFKPWASADELKSWWGHLVIMFSTLIVLIGSCLGLILWRPDKSITFLLIWPLLYFAILHMIFVSSLRYRLPADYPLMILVAYSFTFLFTRFFQSPVRTSKIS